MPEYPNPKLRSAPPPAARGVTPCSLPYAELDVKTNFSFLRGASHPDELAYRAAELGYRAMAVTDVNSLAGVVRVHEAAKEVGLKLLIGSRLTFSDAPDLLVWAPDRPAYASLCRLLTLGKRRTEKGECDLKLEDFLNQNKGLLAGVDLEGSCLRASVPDLHSLREALGDRLSVLASCPYASDDTSRLSRLAQLSKSIGIPLLATNSVHYHDPDRRALQDMLTCVRHGCTIREAGYRLFANGEKYLKSPAQMHRLFADHPGAIRRGLEIADRCNFQLDSLRYEYPDELAPLGRSVIEHLSELTWSGAAGHYPRGIPPKVRELLNHELRLIEQLRFEAYFLTVYDLVRFARSRGILCQGRGSAANSAVCYCLGVTAVDPAAVDLLFERFISAARNEPPDIDIDFEHERREEVIQYIYQKYGRERAGMTAEVITYRGRSAIRDVGKAMGLSLDMVDTMASKLDWWHKGVLNHEQLLECGLDPKDANVRQVIALATQLLGFPRHLSQHVGGMVMTRGPLCEMVPIENASMPDRTVIEWDKDDIDSLGILKVDALALGMLTCISKAFGLVNRERDKGTKGQRDKGWKTALESDDDWKEDGAELQGSNRLATGNGLGAHGIYRYSTHAPFRKIRAGESDVAGSVFDSFQHRRRLFATDSSGLPQVPQDRERIIGGALDPVRVGDQLTNHYGQSLVAEPPGRRRSNSPSPDHESTAQNPKRTSNENHSTPPVTSPTSPPPLCPFVPLSLPSLAPSPLALHTIPHDPAVYDMISDADTVGVFQVESRAQMSMLPRLRPRTFYDLVIEVAIVRPGPIQGNMVHPYLRRRSGEEDVSYPSIELKEVLQKTLGVPLFQEQAMRIAMVAAGFTADEADKLRRVMAAWRRSGAIETFHEKIVTGMIANGYQQEFAEQCFNQIKGFGEYGFPESHAASFALLVYVSAWLKRRHPAAFAAALLNSQPMGFYMPAQIVRDAEEHGVEVRPADINHSDWDCTLEPNQNAAAPPSPQPAQKENWGRNGPAVRLGFREIKGFREVFAKDIMTARARRPFTSVEEFHQRTRLPVNALRSLAEADAFGSIGLSRRQSLWDVLPLKDDLSGPAPGPAPVFQKKRKIAQEGLFDSLHQPAAIKKTAAETEPRVVLPTMPLGQEVMTDYSTIGLSLKQHPMALVREELRRRNILSSAELAHLPHGKWVKVAGLVLIRQRPGTASGIVFETLEDETGIINLIVRPDIYDRYRPAARHAGLLQADGYLQRQGQIMHVLPRRLFDLSDLIRGYEMQSRDFH